MTTLDRCLIASHAITRAESGRAKAWEALRKMRRRPKSFAVLRDYVAASTMVEEAELEILSIKRSLGK